MHFRIVLHVLNTLSHMVNFVYAYLLMLLVMTFSVWLTIAVVVGMSRSSLDHRGFGVIHHPSSFSQPEHHTIPQKNLKNVLQAKAYQQIERPVHTCLLLQLYGICSGKSSKSIRHSGNTDSLSKVLDPVIHETITTNIAFPILPESSWSFCAGTYRSHFWTRCACAKDRNMQICSWKCSARARKTWSKKMFLQSFPKSTLHPWSCKPNRAWNQGAICKNVSCLRESIAESIDCAPDLQNCLQQRGNISKHVGKHTIRSSLSFI